MKLASVLSFLITFIFALAAAMPSTNADRLKRGLSPLPPRRFSPSPVESQPVSLCLRYAEFHYAISGQTFL